MFLFFCIALKMSEEFASVKSLALEYVNKNMSVGWLSYWFIGPSIGHKNKKYGNRQEATEANILTTTFVLRCVERRVERRVLPTITQILVTLCNAIGRDL